MKTNFQNIIAQLPRENISFVFSLRLLLLFTSATETPRLNPIFILRESKLWRILALFLNENFCQNILSKATFIRSQTFTNFFLPPLPPLLIFQSWKIKSPKWNFICDQMYIPVWVMTAKFVTNLRAFFFATRMSLDVGAKALGAARRTNRIARKL